MQLASASAVSMSSSMFVFGSSSSLRGTLRRLVLLGQRLEAGHDVEQLLVDATLTQALKRALEGLERIVDVLLRAIHRRQATGVLAGKRFGAGAKERDEEIFPDE